MTFIDKLSAAWAANDSLLCVGLDPDMARLPAQFQNKPQEPMMQPLKNTSENMLT